MPAINRRYFLKQSTVIGISLMNTPVLTSHLFGKQNITDKKLLAEIKNGSPGKMVQKAIEVLGGISNFVKKNDIVVIKPNIGWARRPEQAANTNPKIVAEIVKLCKAAGAKKIKVFDNTCNTAKRCYKLSGIEKAAKAAGAEVRYTYKHKFTNLKINNGKILKTWQFYSDALEADVFINLPVIKHHSLAKVTMGMKNIMGIIGGNRGQIHNNFNEKLVDLNTAFHPHLTILDGTRILLRNGPAGGNLNDVIQKNTIIAGTDVVAVDALGASLFGIEAKTIGYLTEASDRELGELNLNNMKIMRVNMSA